MMAPGSLLSRVAAAALTGAVVLAAASPGLALLDCWREVESRREQSLDLLARFRAIAATREQRIAELAATREAIEAAGIYVTARSSALAAGRLREQLEVAIGGHGGEVRSPKDDRFICSARDFAAWAEGRRSLRMEWFYREMRRKTGLLMEGGTPAGGRWNFDAENRGPPKADLRFPDPPAFAPDQTVHAALDLVAAVRRSFRRSRTLRLADRPRTGARAGRP